MKKFIALMVLGSMLFVNLSFMGIPMTQACAKVMMTHQQFYPLPPLNLSLLLLVAWKRERKSTKNLRTLGLKIATTNLFIITRL